MAAVAESIMSSRLLSLFPHRPQIAQIYVEAVSILRRERVVIDYVLDVRYRCVELSAVEFTLGQRSVELRQMPLSIIDPLKVFATRASHSSRPPQVFLNAPHQSTYVAIAASLGLSQPEGY